MHYLSDLPMKQRRLERDLEPFFARLAAAPQRALLLDYDGTLAPLVADRRHALPYPGVPEVLAAIRDAGQTRVVVISGRSIADLGQLLGLDPLPELWGTHGWERRLPDGTYLPPALNDQARAGLAEAHSLLSARGLGPALEPKPASLALHWRGFDDAMVHELRETAGQLWSPIALGAGLRVHPFDGGVELRVPGRDKGTAVRALLDELGPDAAVAFLGDDLTDEDAFHALGPRGLSLLVRPEYRPTAAALWLRPPEELLGFLQTWARIDTTPPPTFPKETTPHERPGID